MWADILPIRSMLDIQYHVSSKDQLSWRFYCCFEVKFFYFLDILFIGSMVDMNICLYQRLIVLEAFVIWYCMMLL
jgi:hypothetical protein